MHPLVLKILAYDFDRLNQLLPNYLLTGVSTLLRWVWVRLGLAVHNVSRSSRTIVADPYLLCRIFSLFSMFFKLLNFCMIFQEKYLHMVGTVVQLNQRTGGKLCTVLEGWATVNKI